MASGEVDVSERIKVLRLSERGVYDREEIYPLLDKSFLCHVGYTIHG
jgi:nitroimidazol reductase NimA-like FMN-containing flavoprotein (pyridoxamine 5'-phosphate oxidase superfamily)